MTKLKLEKLIPDFSVCKVPDYSKVDVEKPFCFTGATDEEKSLVCPTEFVPKNVLCREDGWVAFRIKGELDFSLIGILANISRILAEAGIGIFVVSTFNTDYILVKKERTQEAAECLGENGYTVRG